MARPEKTEPLLVCVDADVLIADCCPAPAPATRSWFSANLASFVWCSPRCSPMPPPICVFRWRERARRRRRICLEEPGLETPPGYRASTASAWDRGSRARARGAVHGGPCRHALQPGAPRVLSSPPCRRQTEESRADRVHAQAPHHPQRDDAYKHRVALHRSFTNHLTRETVANDAGRPTSNQARGLGLWTD